MHIRELARQAGGEALVAEIDFGMTVQKKIEAALRAVVEQTVAEFVPEGDEAKRKLVTCALSEAFSCAFAERSIESLTLLGHEKFPEMMLLTIRSVHYNMGQAHDTYLAKEAGVEALIKSAANGGGK